jgi:chemotaxis signal transduction protein
MWAVCWSTCANLLSSPDAMRVDEGAPPPAPGAALHTFAEVELSGIRIGIPAACVAQVITRPCKLAVLPRSHAACEGVFHLGSQVVPLVDLRHWMSPPGPPAAAPLVVVLRSARRVIGLAVSAVHGMRQVPGAAINQVYRDASVDNFFDSVAAIDAEGGLIGLLEPLRLMEQVQAWTADCEALVEPASDGADGGPTSGPVTALQATFRLGGQVMSLPASAVAEVVAWPTLQRPFPSEMELSGTISWRGHHVAMLKASALLGRDAVDADPSHVLVIQKDSRMLALPVDQVLSVRTFAAAAVQASAAMGMARADLFCGIAPLGDDTDVLLLNASELLDQFALSRVLLSDAQGQAAAMTDANADALVVLDVGVEWALSMSTIQEIVVLPEMLQEQADYVLGVSGTVTWNGRILPVLDLCAGAPGARTEVPRLIVVQWRSRWAGLLVKDVIELIPRHAGKLLRFQVLGGASVEMVTVKHGTGQRSVRVMDLAALPFFSGA